jgi:hypothetical protein
MILDDEISKTWRQTAAAERGANLIRRCVAPKWSGFEERFGRNAPKSRKVCADPSIPPTPNVVF